ncbi:hypothetical protein GCM10011390_29210 [Aureimonas endophytica]|uniref:Inner membrane protein n=1 Tax=Aureimonas endophytica TaxID=2027858 RepID=A0A916ZPW0_9HYPH|nr:hypothetical protein [Aureimonas endophytica]GGE08303.1 hypothetical protein GCM10011390_29210 [Aureimonas endophytica]
MTNPPRRSRPKKPGETIDLTAERIEAAPPEPQTADAPGKGDADPALAADPETRLGEAGSPADAPTASEERLSDPMKSTAPLAGPAPDDALPGALAGAEAEAARPEGVSVLGEPEPGDSAAPAAMAGSPSEATDETAEPREADRREGEPSAEAGFAAEEGLDPTRRPDDLRHEELDAETILAAAEPQPAEPPRPNLNYHETPVQHGAHGPGAGGLFGAAILGGAVALIAGGLLQYAGVIPAVGQVDVAQLSQQFARTGDVQQLTTDINTVRNEVAQLQSTLSAGGVGGNGPAATDFAALTDRVTALEGRVGSGNPQPAIDPNVVSGATEAASRAQQAAEAAQARADEARQTAATAQQTAATAQQAAGVAQQAANGAMDATNTNRQAIAEIQGRIGSVEEANKQAAVAIAAAGLKAAVDRGGPFMSELESYAKAAGGSPVVDALRNYAAEGVPTLAELQSAWPASRTAMLKALQPQDANAGVGQQILSGLSGLVAVRPSGQAAASATGPDAGIARLDAALEAGNLDGWNAEWQKLPQAAKDASADFQKRVDARAEAQRVLSQALGQVVNSIGKAG